MVGERVGREGAVAHVAPGAALFLSILHIVDAHHAHLLAAGRLHIVAREPCLADILTPRDESLNVALLLLDAGLALLLIGDLLLVTQSQ